MTTLFSDHHPLAVKFNQYLVETYNAKATGPEVSKIMNDICESNFKILQACYGENSLYNVRTLYTLYTARLH